MTRPTPRLEILPPPAKPPLTVAEALRNIAAEAIERRAKKSRSNDSNGSLPNEQEAEQPPSK